MVVEMPSPLMVVPSPRPRMVVEVPRPVVQKKCPRARFYAQDFRQQITAIALAIVTRFFAAATLRKLKRVAIQHDKYLNAGLSGKGKET